jgi:site-specific recombinase XerD
MTTAAKNHSDQAAFDLAVAAYLGRYRGTSRLHSESDLRVYLRWCASEALDPLAVARADIERYIRWLQDVRCFQPSTVSRRLSIVVGFYRVCVIDQVLSHSPDRGRAPPPRRLAAQPGGAHQPRDVLAAVPATGRC